MRWPCGGSAHGHRPGEGDQPAATPRNASVHARRAPAIWPGLDRARLRHTRGHPMRIARFVATRTSLPIETILALLTSRDRPASIQVWWPGRPQVTPHM